MEKLKNKIISFLRWSERYTKTDMVYLAKGGFWLNANMVITSIFAFVLSIAFAKLVSKEVYGTYQFVISVSSIIGAFTLTGMNTSVTQAVARGFEKVFPDSVKIQIKFGIIPVVIGLGISIYYLINQNLILSASLVVVALLLPLTNALNTWAAFLGGKKEFGDYFKYSQIVNIAYYAGITLIILFIPTALFLVIANFLLNTISNFVVHKLVIKKYKPNQNNEEEAFEYGKKLSLSNVLPMVALNIDNIIIFHSLGSPNLAIYIIPSHIPERISGLLRPISVIALPKFSEKKPSEVKSSVFAKLWKLSALALLGWLFYFFLSPFLFKIFFPQYTQSVTYSQIYAIVFIFSTFSSLLSTALSSIRSKALFKFNIINPLFNVAIIFIMVYFFGLWGAIIGKITGSVFQTALSWYYLNNSAGNPA